MSKAIYEGYEVKGNMKHTPDLGRGQTTAPEDCKQLCHVATITVCFENTIAIIIFNKTGDPVIQSV